jgi:hypothetical protein
MATTTNYGWTTPDDTALVKDGAAAIRTLGSSVDTTTKALNPSTTLGDLEYRSATANTNTRLGIGSTGNVLTVSGGVPVWAAPAAGGMTEIASGTLSSTLVLISSIPTTYNSLRLVVRNFKPITDNCNMRMRFNNDSTANRHLADSSSTGVSTRAFDATFSPISYSADNSSAEGTAVIDIPDYANTTTWKSAFIFSMVNSGTSSTTANAYWNMQGYNQTGAITSLGLLAEGSGFTSGTYILYGVK